MGAPILKVEDSEKRLLELECVYEVLNKAQAMIEFSPDGRILVTF